jgi:hypothetical protein
MIDVLEKLRKAPTNPEVSLHLFYPELHSIMIEGVRRMLLRVCQKPKIVTLTLRICYSRQWFGICSQLQHLRPFSILGIRNSTSSERLAGADLGKMFENSPLEDLSLESPDIIQSFPSTLKALRLTYHRPSTQPLPFATWLAVCDLQDLVDLQLLYHDLDDMHGYVPRFKSEKLKTLTIIPVTSAKSKTFMQSLLQPVLAACELLSLQFQYTDQLFWSLVLPVSMPSTSLSRLDVSFSKQHNYLFRELISHLKDIPNLRDLNLPWPTSIDAPGETVEGRNTDSILEIYQRLTFDECSALVTACPKLTRMTFQLESEGIPLAYGPSSRRSHDLIGMPLDQDLLGEGWTDHHTFMQSFKMVTLIDETSPCLDVCTAIYFPHNTAYRDSEMSSNYIKRATVALLLKQVRNHTNHA